MSSIPGPLALALTLSLLPDPPQTTRASLGAGGGQTQSLTNSCAVSADGRCIAFVNADSDLVPGDVNGVADVFLRDVWSGTTERVSVDSNGVGGRQASSTPVLSADGRFVAFSSPAANLVGDDRNERNDVFVRDRVARRTVRVSVDSHGEEGEGDSLSPALSADGRFVAFLSESDLDHDHDGGGPLLHGGFDIYVRDLEELTTERVSVNDDGEEGDGDNLDVTISPDGNRVAWTSEATNFVDDDTNGMFDIFVRDLARGTTVRASVTSTGEQANGHSSEPALSADGRYVAFVSSASNLVPGDTNGNLDIFVRDLATGTTVRASVDSLGAQGNGACFSPSLSWDGRWLAFQSNSSNLVPGDTNGQPDAFLHDLALGRTRRVSVDSDGAQADGGTYRVLLDGPARSIVFTSLATNLVPADTNGVMDVFRRER